MSRLLLRFDDASLDSFDWVISDESSSIGSGWQQGSQSQLSSLLSKHALPVVFVIPQQHVYFTEFQLPERASRQILSSIEYQIEDQLAQDTELQHYATGKDSENGVPVVVVEKSIMKDCHSLQEKYGIRVVQIIPELFLCPWQGKTGEVNLIESHQSFLLRYGTYRGIKFERHLLGPVLDLIHREQSIEAVNYYLEDEVAYEDIKIETYPANYLPVSALSFNAHNTDIINLQQREFQASSQWLNFFKAWKTIAILIIVLLGSSIYSRVLALQDLETELAAVKASQYELVKEYLDPNVTAADNLKKEVIKVLQRKGDKQGARGFLDLLSVFSQSKQVYPAIEVVKIGYQQQRLSVDFNSRKLDDVEALHATLNATGLTVNLERLNIKPDFISGQFVVEGSL
ncbi:MAG: type II secretion system protein GspL [Gammaproteobacteria bacterium]|nr:type II secretion system protein GspL [Gammaproteobacteria bacterium]